MLAVVLPVLIGFLALGIDVGSWDLKSRQAQAAADAAATAGAPRSPSRTPRGGSTGI